MHKKTYVLVQTAREFNEYRRNAIKKNPMTPTSAIVWINPDQAERLKGLEITKDNFKVVGDPRVPFSVWQEIQIKLSRP